MAEKGKMQDLSEVGLDINYGLSRGAAEAYALAAEMDRQWNINHPSGPVRPVRQIYIQSWSSIPLIQGEVPQGGGYTCFAGTFNSNTVNNATISVTVHLDRVNYPAFYYQFTDNPVVATLNQVPYTVEWSVNLKTFLFEVPKLPSAFDAQGKIFEQKFNLFTEWMQYNFLPQAQNQIVTLQQVIIIAPDSPGELLQDGVINFGDINLNQGHIINFGDSLKTSFP
jgi:hypothetical protein